MIALALTFHILGAVIWVGGMFFAYMVLRPSASELDADIRLPLWDRALDRFFVWVWVCVAALLASGLVMVIWGFGGFAAVRVTIRLMMMLGMAMSAIYAWVYFVPWRRYRQAVTAQDWPAGQRSLNQIRQLVGLNLVLGLGTVAVAASGRYL
jgi:uncharacterized membrane protein